MKNHLLKKEFLINFDFNWVFSSSFDRLSKIFGYLKMDLHALAQLSEEPKWTKSVGIEFRKG